MKKDHSGLLVTLEGIEGMGKSTAIIYLHKLLKQAGIKHQVTREPGGTEIAEAIRQILLHRYQEQMALETELLLLFASRAQHISQLIKPALLQGQWVLCDRFVDASYAYQGGGRGIPLEKIAMLDCWLLEDLTPDLTILLDAPVEVGMVRIHERGEHDRFENEKKAFFSRVRAAYLQRAKECSQRFRIVDANCSLEQVQQQLKTIINQYI